MTKKKNKFLTFCCSLLPGAAHMYMGFMKMGISLMSGFFFIIAAAAFLRLDAVLFLLPIIWFYAFFDANNKNAIDDEEFYQLEDQYLFQIDQLKKMENLWNRRGNIIIAVILIFCGIYLIFNQVSEWLISNNLLTSAQSDMLWMMQEIVPEIILAFVIIFLGIRLIKGKKKEYDKLEQGGDFDGKTY